MTNPSAAAPFASWPRSDLAPDSAPGRGQGSARTPSSNTQTTRWEAHPTDPALPGLGEPLAAPRTFCHNGHQSRFCHHRQHKIGHREAVHRRRAVGAPGGDWGALGERRREEEGCKPCSRCFVKPKFGVFLLYALLWSTRPAHTPQAEAFLRSQKSAWFGYRELGPSSDHTSTPQWHPHKCQNPPKKPTIPIPSPQGLPQFPSPPLPRHEQGQGQKHGPEVQP